MNTLMTIWLITGSQLQLYTDDYACSQAMKAIATNGVVIVTLENGFPVQAREVKCECPDVEGEGEPT